MGCTPGSNKCIAVILGFHPRDLYLDNGCYAAILVSYYSNISRVIKALGIFFIMVPLYYG